MMTFQEARAFLLKHRTDYDKAVADFRWPDAGPFNWALDWFDAELARDPQSRDRPALWIVDAGSHRETKLSFAVLSRRSNQVANFLRAQGLKRGDHLLLLLGNVVPLWETMLRDCPAVITTPLILPSPQKRTTREFKSTAARATAAPRVLRRAKCTDSMTSGGDSRQFSLNESTAASAAVAAYMPCPNPSATKMDWPAKPQASPDTSSPG